MTRTIVILLVALLVPTAAAAGPGENAQGGSSVEAPAVDLAALAASVADGAAAAASGTIQAASAAGSALVGSAKAIVGAVVAAAKAIGSAVAFVVTGSIHLLASLASALGAALVAIASATAHAVAVVASFVMGLLGLGYEAARAHPREAAVVGGAATGLGSLAWFARRYGAALLAPLYTRLAPSQMLDNEARASVYRFVREHPGVHPSAIAEALSLGWGTTVYHLQRLESARLLTQRAGASHRKCYFAVGAELDAQEREALAAMAGDKPRLIVEALRERPGMSQKELADRLGVSQALLSFHVKKLVASGVLLSTREGRSNLLHVAEHVPAPAPFAGAAPA